MTQEMETKIRQRLPAALAAWEFAQELRTAPGFNAGVRPFNFGCSGTGSTITVSKTAGRQGRASIVDI